MISLNEVAFAVDAGGSATRVNVRPGHQTIVSRRWPSANPASIGHAEAIARWTEMLRWIAGHGRRPVGWIASASVAAHSADQVSAVLTLAAKRAGADATIVLSNDVLPLLLAPPVSGHGIALIAGTGSCCLGGTSGRFVHAGGHEYVLSDEGSGYQLGLAGLRAAARAFDGTGPCTELQLAARRFGLCPIPELGRRLAEAGNTKGEVASFAVQVMHAAAGGDALAKSIVAQAVDDLVLMAATVHHKLGGEPMPLVVAGSISHESSYFRARLLSRMAQSCPGLTPTVLRDGMSCCWFLAERCVKDLDFAGRIDHGGEVLRIIRARPEQTALPADVRGDPAATDGPP